MADLLTLALRALEDETVLPVLGDLILESGWDDQRAWSLITRAEPYKVDPLFEGHIQKRWRTEAVSKPTPKLARAVVAVLLFGDWPRRWPLAVANARELHDQAWREGPHWDWTRHAMVAGERSDQVDAFIAAMATLSPSNPEKP